MEPRTFLELLALSVVLALLLVAGRFIWCLVLSVRARRYRIAVLCVLGVALIVTLFGAVIAVWFGYAVAHTGKSINTDIKIFLITVPPYFLCAIVLWFLAGYLRSRLRSNPAQKTLDADVGGAESRYPDDGTS